MNPYKQRSGTSQGGRVLLLVIACSVGWLAREPWFRALEAKESELEAGGQAKGSKQLEPLGRLEGDVAANSVAQRSTLRARSSLNDLKGEAVAQMESMRQEVARSKLLAQHGAASAAAAKSALRAEQAHVQQLQADAIILEKKLREGAQAQQTLRQELQEASARAQQRKALPLSQPQQPQQHGGLPPAQQNGGKKKRVAIVLPVTT